MKKITLSDTRLQNGIWEGMICGAGRAPDIEVSHRAQVLESVTLVPEGADWRLQFPIPAAAISDGIQTLTISERSAGQVIGYVTLLAGETLGDDLRAEVTLLRAELDMLKRAFRRHCAEGE